MHWKQEHNYKCKLFNVNKYIKIIMTIAKNKFDNIFANRSNIKLHVY